MMLFTKAFEKAIAKFPIRSQDGKGKDAKVLGRFFCGSYTWYILEGNDVEFFALVGNGDDCFEYFHFYLLHGGKLASENPVHLVLGGLDEPFGERVLARLSVAPFSGDDLSCRFGDERVNRRFL